MRKESSTNYLNEKDLTETCGMFYTLNLIGGRWKVSILAALLDNSSLRYSQIKNKLPGITERMLIKQLKELQHDGIISRRDYNETPPRVEYQVTSLGKSLESILEEMHIWGKNHKPINKV